MKYIIIDLEWNGNQTADGYFNEIIEIGAVSLDENMNVISEFQQLVKPKVTKKLKGRIKELTHITNDELKNAEGFVSVYNKLKKWIGCDDDNCLLSWGNADVLVLYENLNHYNMVNDIYVIRHFCDAQLLCQQALEISLAKQVGLSALAEMAEIDIGDAQLHRALNDSKLTAKCLAKLFTEDLYDQFAKVADKEFYERINFKSYSISDPDDERIRQNNLMVECPNCGIYMKRLTKFSHRNKKHYARYQCGGCGRSYNISHSFKITYDGLVHKNTLTEIGGSSTDDETA
ncbi:MAG: exonuclease domain-containing protein [Acutalibacteraceae bacterium]|nr:exonuclease domain-containing protein [Bacillota bacterium]